MTTTVHSNIEPAVISIDRIENGIARLLVHWDIQQVSVPDPMTGTTHEEWQYSERVIKWVLPKLYSSIDEIQTYLIENQAEILDWAKATEFNT